MKAAIVGSRSFTDYSKFKLLIDRYRDDISYLISGGAIGVDSMAEQYAIENSIPIDIIKPDWSIGRSAGFKRNIDIINNCDMALIFWDGESSGTKHDIELCKTFGKFYILFDITKI